MTKTLAWKGEIPLKHLYTAGLAGSDFLKTLKEKGEITGTFCEHCERVYVPARYFCEKCFAQIGGNIRTLPLEGKLVSWTQSHLDLKGRRLKKPVLAGAVRLDGASTVLIHFLKTDPSKLEVGQRFKAILKPAGERTGSILDIQYFAPV